MRTKIRCDGIEITNDTITFLSDGNPIVTFDYYPEYPLTITGLEVYLPASIEVGGVTGGEAITQSTNKTHKTPRYQADLTCVDHRTVWRDVIWATKIPDPLKTLTARVYNYLLNARFPQDHWEAQKRHSGKGDSRVICEFAGVLYQHYPPGEETRPVFRCTQYILDQLDVMAKALADCFKPISVHPFVHPMAYEESKYFADPESREELKRRWKDARDAVLYVLGGVDYEPYMEKDNK